MGHGALLDYPALDRGRPPRPDRWQVGILAAIALGGGLLRLAFLDEPMRYDEAFTFVGYVTLPVGTIVSTYDLPNNHILHTLLAHFSWRVFGDHVWTVRLDALLAGVALVPAAYLAARAVYDRWAGLWAAGLVAGLAPLVDYSVNGRGYMLGILLVTLGLWLGAGLLDRSGDWWRWMGFTVCLALAVYAVPTMAYAAATVATFVGGSALVRRDLGLVVRLALACLAVAAIDLLLYSAVLDAAGWTYAASLHSGAGPVRRLSTLVWENWNRAAPHPLDWIVAAGFVASLVLHRRLAPRTVPLAAAAAAVVVGVIAVGRVAPLARAWLYLLPLYAIHAAAGLSYAARRLPRPALANAAGATAVALALCASVLHSGELHADQAPSSDNHIVGFLRHQLRPGEATLLDPASVAVASSYYFHRHGYTPPPLPARRRPVTTLVMVRRSGGRGSVDHVVQDAGWRLRPGAPPPRLVRRFEYVEAWEARLE